MAAERSSAAIPTSRSSSSRSSRCATTSPSSAACATRAGESGGPHGIIEETWLNCVQPAAAQARTPASASRPTRSRRRISAKDVTLPSLELCGEPGGMISFRTPDQPLPMESNPRKVFFVMFGQGDTKEERQAILEHDHEPARLREGVDGEPEPQARRGRPREGRATTWIRCARSSSACRSSRSNAVARESSRRAARSAGRFRRAARHAVRDVRARVADEPHERRHDEDGRRGEHADVPEPGRPRGVPPDVALGRIPGPHRQPAQDPELPHRGVREVRAAARGYAGRQRHRCSITRSSCSAATWRTATRTTTIRCRRR